MSQVICDRLYRPG